MIYSKKLLTSWPWKKRLLHISSLVYLVYPHLTLNFTLRKVYPSACCFLWFLIWAMHGNYIIFLRVGPPRQDCRVILINNTIKPPQLCYGNFVLWNSKKPFKDNIAAMPIPLHQQCSESDSCQRVLLSFQTYNTLSSTVHPCYNLHLHHWLHYVLAAKHHAFKFTHGAVGLMLQANNKRLTSSSSC